MNRESRRFSGWECQMKIRLGLSCLCNHTHRVDYPPAILIPAASW